MVPKLQINLSPEAMWSLEKADEEGAEVCGYFRFLLTSALLWARLSTVQTNHRLKVKKKNKPKQESC